MTLFLVKLIGPIGLIVGLGLVFNPKFYRLMIDDMMKHPLTLYIACLGAMLAGLSIILTNNLWSTPNEVIISLIGWLSFLKGALFTFTPVPMEKISKSFSKSNFVLWGGLLWVILGAYLCWAGYFA